MKPVRVLIADDEPSILLALTALIRSEPSLQLVGEAADAEEALDLVGRLHPDVVLSDVRMAGGGGERVARELRETGPPVVVLSAREDRPSILEMLRAGAVGYVVKGAPVEEIVKAVQDAVRGMSALSPEASTEVVQELAGRLERQEVDEIARREAERRIRPYLDGTAVPMAYQPIVDLRTLRPVGVEALARFEGEPHRPPNEWFAEAATVGLRAELELAAIRAALSAIPLLPASGYLSVNVSPEVALSDGFPNSFAGWPAERIVVEITEHAPVEDYAALEDALKGFRAAGGRIAIDDAGAGFASLRHILRLAPDAIKLDISLTAKIDTDRQLRALARALISFASDTGAEVVAEGIETEGELEELKVLGVRYGQGYHLGRPAPLDAVGR